MVKRKINFLLIALVGLAVIFYGGNVSGRDYQGQVNVFGLDKMTAGVSQSLSNIGNWAFWAKYDGQTGHDPYTGGSGGYYPIGTTTSIYMDGIIWGGKVKNVAAPSMRVGGIGYRIGTIPGWIDESGAAVDQSNTRVRMYRIRGDYATLTEAQVKQDVAQLNNVAMGEVSSDMAQEVIDQYKLDWKEWPTDLGAPFVDKNGNGVYDPVLDGEGYPDQTAGDFPGIANADQVLWWVVNDLSAGAVNSHSGVPPIGLELQITLWGYNQPGAGLGQIVFKKYRLINKSGTTIDSMFLAQYSDPDLGDAPDDYVGCDVEKSLHYVYNSGAVDAEYAKYNLVPPSAGYDFFQGPIVETGNTADTAVFDLKYRAGYKNLPMTSFGYFAAGGVYTDPPMGVLDFTLQWYNMLNGFAPTNDTINPTPFTHGSGPLAGQPTKFPLDGNPPDDPSGAVSDIDGQGTNMAAGDRRMFAASGPFTMAPLDTQELVVALVAGMGADFIQSITVMKNTDVLAQKLYDDLFSSVPKAPAPPNVAITNTEEGIILNWGSDQGAVGRTEADNALTGYNFQGYNIYQVPTASSAVSAGKRVATYDLVDGVTIITGKRFLPEYGQIVEIPVQYGEDKGVQRFFVIDQDYLNSKPLYQGTTYYFAVTAYNYNAAPQLIEDMTLESAPIVLAITHQGPKPGVRFGTVPEETFEVNHSSATAMSDGIVEVSVVDPGAVTGHDYKVTFVLDDDPESATNGQIVWNLVDNTTGTTVISKQRQLGTSENGKDAPIADGLQVKVFGPANDYKLFEVVANNAGPLVPSDIGTFAFNSNGFPFLFNDRYPEGGDRPTQGVQQVTNNGKWGICTGEAGAADASFDYFKVRTTQGGARWSRIVPYDWEIRFTYDADNYGYEPNAFVTGAGTGGTLMTMPFELWRIGIGTPNDPSDDVRLFPYLIDSDADGVFNASTVDNTVSGGDNDPETDWFYWVLPQDRTPGEAGYTAIMNDVVNNTAGHVYLDANLIVGDVMRRMVLVNWNGGSVSAANYPANLNSAMPEQGTIFRITTNKPNSTDDQFTFTTKPNTNSAELAKEDVGKVNVFPNPYYAYNSLESSRFDRFVTFTHLPQKAEIRIFNLAGLQVRKLDKDDANQFYRWNLQNESGLPVASGIYIVHVDMPDLGKTKVLKLFIVQSEQVLEYF